MRTVRPTDCATCESLEIRRVLSPIPYPAGVGDLQARIVAAADFNADGAKDLLWQDFSSGEIYIEEQTGVGSFSKHVVGTADAQRWQLVGIADVNGDGSTPDLIFFDTQKRVPAFWRMDGVVVQEFRLIPSAPIAEGWRFQATGNFDSDHDDADYIWRNYTNGKLCVWNMSLGAAFGGFHIFDGPTDLNWALEYASDLTGDGQPDLLWRNYANGKTCLWEMAWAPGVAAVRSFTMLPTFNTQPQVWDIEAVGEFDNDNRDDILWRNYTTGDVMIWAMDGTIRLHELILFTRAE